MEELELFEAVNSLPQITRYKPDPVPREALDKIIEAATKAPNGGNKQPWEFIVITDRDFIVDPPILQIMSPVTLLPLTLRSCLLHMPCIMPVDMAMTSRCSEASRQTVLFIPWPGRFDIVFDISQRPAFSLGKSCAAAVGGNSNSNSTASAYG